jgi:Spy/CpxP family protein refolding chaperone
MKKLLILAGIVALTASTQVFAQDGPQQKGASPMAGGERPKIECGCARDMHKPHGDFKKLEEKLNLTDIQKAKIKQIKEREAQAVRPLIDKIQAKDKEAQAVFNEKLTEQERQEKLAPIGREIEQTRAQIRDIKKHSKDEFKSVLTDKQVKKLEKLKKQERKNAQKVGKKGPHGPEGRPQFGPDGRPPIGPEGRPPMGEGFPPAPQGPAPQGPAPTK